jgi:hypothetical protein
LQGFQLENKISASFFKRANFRKLFGASKNIFDGFAKKWCAAQKIFSMLFLKGGKR